MPFRNSELARRGAGREREGERRREREGERGGLSMPKRKPTRSPTALACEQLKPGARCCKEAVAKITAAGFSKAVACEFVVQSGVFSK